MLPPTNANSFRLRLCRTASLLIGSFAVLILSAGCETVPDIDAAEQGMRTTVKDGVATREQLVLALGTPSAEFENGRILTYLLTVGETGQLRPVPRQQAILPDQAVYRWRSVTHNLVLVFRPDGVLDKHSLLRVNP